MLVKDTLATFLSSSAQPNGGTELAVAHVDELFIQVIENRLQSDSSC